MRIMAIRSVVSTLLIAAQECIGALKIYSDRAGAFGEHAARVLELFAARRQRCSRISRPAKHPTASAKRWLSPSLVATL